MATISENLQTIKNSVSAIKQAISDKGGDVSGDISTWAGSIGGLSGGGGSSSGGPGSVFKITNKLNGQLIGGPTFTGTFIHKYELSGGYFTTDVILAYQRPLEEYTGSERSRLPYVEDIIPGYRVEDYTHLLKFSSVASTEQEYGKFNVYTHYNEDYPVGGPHTIYVYCYGNSSFASSKPLSFMYIAVDSEGNYDIDYFQVQGGGPCFTKGTKISLSDSTTKNVEDITYNDNLLVWNFDEGKYDSAKPLWIKKTQVSTCYYKVTLDNGTVLKLVGSEGKCHRLFSLEDGMFISATDMIGKTTFTESGNSKVLSCELIQEEVEFYNVITDYHINLFANGVLTSCRYNNIYPIQDMKFVKDDRLNRAPKWKLYEQFRDYKCLGRYIEGMRLYEQLDIPLEDTIKYCERLESLRKTLDEFEGNENILNNIEDTEVGWIDREGKSYGFKLYMSGQYNHIIIADKICKELNIETDNPYRYLEKEGWVKYTTDYILSSDYKEINDKQLKSLRKFLKVPNKLKEDSKIRIGDYMSPHVDISEFDTMDKYSFEYRKKHNRIR